MKKLYENFGIYLHVPFCARPCGYCRFYKKVPTKDDIDFYIETLAKEIKLFAQEHELPSTTDTMFWGGGTPSILSPQQIEKIANTFGELLPKSEWTVEVSPSTITREKLDAFRDVGVDRISLGVQSFSEKTLKTLGRAHTLQETLNAIDLIAERNFKNFSIDLIFGANGQTQQEWLTDIEKAATAPVNHISAYCLEFESGTSSCAGLKTQQQLDKNISDADLFQTAMSRLPELGFNQYEISNYALTENAQCLHNLSTWHMAQWVGFGPSAASQFSGKRYRNQASVAKWAECVNARKMQYDDIVILDDEEMYSSALIFGLRMNDGINLQELKQRFPSANFDKYEQTILALIEENLIEQRGEKIALTDEGKLVADSVAVELL